ncbi:MAG: T9SS type A sorting domain-containing protein [Saprospiraceae bacterium]|nr:T9SS type A sorting domain-containing protein [Saprospiraceae bacterium]
MRKSLLFTAIWLCMLNFTLGQSETEPNNNAGQANTLLYNGMQNGTISEPDGSDWYKINLPIGGVLKLLFISDGGPESNIYIADSTNTGSTIGFASFGFQAHKRDSIIIPLLKGTYYVFINHSRGGGSYSITSSLQVLQYPEDNEPNNTFDKAGVLNANGNVTGLMGHYSPNVKGVDPSDWYKLKVDKGGVIKLLFLSDGGPESNIFISDSMNLGSSLGFASFGFQAHKRDSIIVPLLKGTYYVFINQSRGSGSYSITSSLQVLQYPEDEEPNNSFDNAGVLNINGNVTGLIGHYSPNVKDYDPSDWYKLTVDKGGVIKLLFLSDGGPEANIFISDSMNLGSSLGFASFGFQDRKRDSITVPLLKGTYYVYINRSRGSGSYSIQSFFTLPNWPEDIEPNDDFMHSGLLAENSTISGLINYYNPAKKDYDPVDWYTLNVTNKGLIIIRLQSDGALESNIYLVDSLHLNGSIKYANFNFKEKTQDSLVALVEKGRYYMVIYRSRGSGAYKANFKFLLPPKADFDYVQNNTRIVFENKTIRGDEYIWNFDDGSPNIASVNPMHEYAEPGDYDVCLIAKNRAGQDTSCARVFVKGLSRIYPNSGGNTGDVTFAVFGGGLDTFYKVSLAQNGITVVQSLSVAAGEKGSLAASFDLRGKVEGIYDVVVSKTGENPYILPGGFTIKKGLAPDPWIRINGRNRILFNTWTTYTVEYGNNGNVDASVVPAWLVFERTPGFDLKFVNVNFQDQDPDESMYVDLDSLSSRPFNFRVYPLLLPVIPPGEVGSFKIKVKTGQNIKMYAWTEKPWFQSPLNDKKLGCVNTSIENAAETVKLDGDQLVCVINRSYYSFNNILKTTLSNKKSNYIQGRIIVAYIASIGKIFKECEVVDEAVKEKFKEQMIKFIFALVDRTHGGVFLKKSSNDDESCSAEFEPQNPQSSSVTTVSSLDPNEKTGLTGYGENNYVPGQKTIPYTIHFENKASATAPAHVVYVSDTLDKTKFDLTSFSLGDIVIGDQVIRPEKGLKEFVVDEKIIGMDVTARIYGHIDQNTGIVNWIIRSLDPVTLEDIEDPDIGFLPPNNTDPEGQGSVSFTVQLKGEPRHEEQIFNAASIIFDANAPIFTNNHLTTFDILAPESSVAILPATTQKEKITINWYGTDSGSGLRTYSIYVSTSDVKDSLWIDNTTETEVEFFGEEGVTYQFYSIASDNAGNIEEIPLEPDAEISFLVDTDDPNADDRLKVFPNPANDILQVVSEDISGLFSITDLHGRVITQIQIRGTSRNQINVQDWFGGFYLWTLSNDSGITRSGKIDIK